MRPWLIHDIAPDFRVLDVWALPTPGGEDDFPRLVELLPTVDLAGGSALVKALFAIRFKVGGLLGLDRPPREPGGAVRSLRARVPADLPAGPSVRHFSSLYLTEDEWALELANQTVHGVLHVGWVRDGEGYRGELTVLVKPNGLFGKAYLAAISPFRHRLVYPAMLRQIGEAWQPVP
jgi:Protein of unknown function (DUF2867)